RVTDSERAGYEERARADGLADFQITEAGANGRTVAAQHRREYFPVYFVESFSGTRRALGFDLASEPIRREALDRARDTGRAAASDPLTLIRRRESEPSFVVLVPVYK